MAFGFLNILASFQNYINKILTQKIDIFVIIYLNNILIYKKDKSKSQITDDLLILDLLIKNKPFAYFVKTNLIF